MQQEKVHLPDYSLQKYKEYNSKFNTGSTTIEELKENLENCIRSRVSLKKELKQYSLSNLKGLLVLSEVFINNEEYFNEDLKIPNYAGSAKELVINQLYKSMLKYFCLGRNLDDSVSSSDITESRLIEIVRKAISSLTEIDLREMAKKVTLYRTFLNKALNKPRTKAEFTFFISYKGKNSLDPVQKILWNNLLANAKPTNYQINQQVKGDNSMSSTTTTIATSQPNVWASFNKEKTSQVSKSNNTNITSKKEKSVNVNGLEKAANTLAKKSEAILSKQRLTNTVRRSNIADNIEANARKELRLAKTILNLVEAIKERKSTYLMSIRYRSQVQVLEYMLRAAKGNRSRALKHCDWIDKDRELEMEDIEFVRYPYPWVTKDNFKKLVLVCEKAVELNGFVADLNVLFALDLKKEDSENLYFNSQEKIDLLRSIISALKGINHSVTKSMADSLSYQAQDCETLQSLGLCDLSVLKEALKEYLQYRSNQAKEDPIKRMERDLIGVKIPSYFPTPKELIEKMLDLAKIEAGMKVLEPSAGVGHIADQIRKQIPNTDLSVIEINHRLKEILEAKGHNLVCRDFLYHKEEYSRIVMNPPFHNGEDMEHLYHAYSLLSPGGRVVSIMSEGSFFRTDKKAVEFREWFDSVEGISEKLQSGTFLNSDRPTAVATRIVFIDKAAQLTPSVVNKQLDTNVNVIENTIENTIENAMDESQILVSEETDESLSPAEEANQVEVDNTNTKAEAELSTIVNASEAKQIGINIPSNVLDKILEIVDIEKDMNVLEAFTNSEKDNDESFLDHQKSYDRIILYPYSERQQSIKYVQQAYDLLIARGKLVAVVSEEFFTASNREAITFRKWLKALGAITEQLPEGTLVDKQTSKGISARVVVMDKYSLF